MAGTGKSTIARTIARDARKQDRLAASFFFARGTRNQSRLDKLFTTIAAQMTSMTPPLRRAIADTLISEPDVVHKSPRDQWAKLIMNPLSTLGRGHSISPLVLVIDALDECDDDAEIRTMLQLFSEAFELQSVSLKILVTSRPEVPIRLRFRDMDSILHRDLILNKVDRNIVNHDLSIFIRRRLAEIPKSHESLPNDWPGDKRVASLVSKADGLFIYAATICRFLELEGDQWPPDCLLNQILDSESRTGSYDNSQFNEPHTHGLDSMYTQIINYSFRNVQKASKMEALASEFRKVIGPLVILFNPLSIYALSNLLGIEKEIVNTRTRLLHSVLDISRPDTPIGLLHPSFRDFLLDKSRCQKGEIHINEKVAHSMVLDACIQLMQNQLCENICRLEFPGPLLSDIPDDLIKKYLSPELQYACQFWVQHLERGYIQLEANNLIELFLKQHFLHWLEALSLIRKTSEAITMITTLQTILMVSK